MKIVICNGQNHKGSTYHIGKMLAEQVGGEIKEYFFPKDFSPYCAGCNFCFMDSEEKCPHYGQQKEIRAALDEADLIILTSPVYVYHVTAPMKNFLDHQAYRWMVHRPRKEMFQKQAVCISTAAGAGMKSTNKDMKDSLFFWGIPKIYQIGAAVHAVNWQQVTPKQKNAIEKKTAALAAKIRQKQGKVKAGIKTKAFFHVMRIMQKKLAWCEADVSYWNEMGWTADKRPWNN